MSRDGHCPSYQGAYYLVRETDANQIVPVMPVSFQTEDCVGREGTRSVVALGSQGRAPGSGALADTQPETALQLEGVGSP